MMYMIMVELNGRPADQYADLERAIKALGNWSNRIRNTWMVETQFSASQIRDLLKPTLVAGRDRLFVARFTPNWSGYGMGEGFGEWMGRREFEAPAKAATTPTRSR
jgi:hypothetical protein